MNIGISCYPTYGGSGMVATELGLFLARRGHEVHFIAYDVPRRLDLSQEGIHFHRVDVTEYPLFQYPPYSLALSVKIAEVAEARSLDLMHAHYAIPHAVSSCLAKQISKKASFKTLTTLHGTDITLVGSNKSYYALVKYCLENIGGITAVSRFLKEETLKIFNLDRDIRCIYNFIDPEIFRRRPEPSDFSRIVPPDRKIVMHISNFRPVKRVRDLVDIFRLIRNETPCTLVMIGDGPERGPVEEKCRRLDLQDDVIFHRGGGAVPDYLSHADLFLLTSETESFGLAALEAMACEVPVVSTDVGGVPELVDEGVNGFLCSLGDNEMMARKAAALLKDEDMRRAFARAAREKAATSFHIEKKGAEYEQFYFEMLAE
jgi:N-acetyl-alpha-D-glucosaminyl L-malate synthase BshA